MPDIEFRHGTARLVVSVFSDSTYRVGKLAPASSSSEDVRYAHWLSQIVKPFLRALSPRLTPFVLPPV
jgi:hypothetical protein